MDILKKVDFFYFRLLFRIIIVIIDDLINKLRQLLVHCLIRELTGTYGFVTAMRDS